MFALVNPSTFISLKMDFGLALSRPSALTAASKRECRSVVQTKRRFCVHEAKYNDERSEQEVSIKDCSEDSSVLRRA